ncbi:GNAT family N-acetyltransferase [Candidatus Chloroploca sp. Khr17]|uniref:GNAT family N-acetyltransferase n=1 Tax=Candidatus Chloroploca sp. Khr17 TaxID=2496869 RepID=UPI00101BE6DC|nr:GNAT family N-acetyltransferase [Candidatus Chloroploca sp. Khr17]
MWLFRKSIDLNQAVARPVQATDLTAVTRLLREAGRRYYAMTGADLEHLTAEQWGAVLEVGTTIVASALANQPAEGICWIYAVALGDGLDVRFALATLLPVFEATLRRQGVHTIFYAGDEQADAWLVPALQAQQFEPETEVVVYEKRQLQIPDQGNLAITLRPALPLDLPAVLTVDRACFEPQWTKDATIMRTALEQGPYVVVAEHEETIVGYAYATTHFGGRLVHLVRIAVDPAWRGKAIGVRLLADVVAFTIAQRAHVLTLNTQAYNMQAQRLYQWFGFVTTGERQLILRRNLHP